ncbi:YopX family protein [Streptococcus mitis]|uniref:YopX family protein n=1 Tax=Streptococcus mitis TaxID=28037 RepID=UPI0021B5EA9B|nr:YopX family protein [Streptococcus mitis]
MTPKFRAYDGSSLNRMYQPDEVMVGNGDIWIIDEDSVAGEWIVNNDLELMQSTGLKDKNGKEIFEGDVVRQVRTQPTTENETITGVVTMLEGAWLIMNDCEQLASFLWSETDENEIIGNVYENPELLEVIK